MRHGNRCEISTQPFTPILLPVCVVDGDVGEEYLEVDDVLGLPPDVVLPLFGDLLDALAVPDQQLGHVDDQLAEGGNHLYQKRLNGLIKLYSIVHICL